MNREVPDYGSPGRWSKRFALRLSRASLLTLSCLLVANTLALGQAPVPTLPPPKPGNRIAKPASKASQPTPASLLPPSLESAVIVEQPERPPVVPSIVPDRLPLPGGPQGAPGTVPPGYLPPANTQPAPSPFPPGAYRLPLLDPDAVPYEPRTRTPNPSPKDLAFINRFVEEVIDPRSSLDLIQHRPRLLKLKENPTKTQVGDPKVAQLEVIGERQVSVLGLEVGTTVLNLWFKDPADPNTERVLSYLLRVVPDPEQKARMEAAYRALAKEINHAFPDAHVCLTLVGDKVVVSGQAKDVAEATQILRVVQANAPNNRNGKSGEIPPVGNVNLTVQPGELPGGAPNLNEFLFGNQSNIVNRLRVAGEQQVSLKVIVAEIDRSAARSIGLDFNVVNNNGITVFGTSTGGLRLNSLGGLGRSLGGLGGLGGIGGFGGGGFNTVGLSNIQTNFDNGQIGVAISALRRLRYAKLLAEPTLTALNGQTASFQAGGSFPVPVVTGFTAAGLQGVQFVPFGVQVQFTPIITDRDRIRLQVRAEVSATDANSGTNIGGSNINGLQTRNFQSVVELREGQTLGVAGLIQNTSRAESARVPFIGDLPIIGRMAGLDQTASDERELVILVTPQMVHPIDEHEVPALPGSDVFEPSDIEFYAWGRLESYRPVDYRTAVRTDLKKMMQYHRCEEKYIFGASGHSDTPPTQPANFPPGPVGSPARIIFNPTQLPTAGPACPKPGQP